MRFIAPRNGIIADKGTGQGFLGILGQGVATEQKAHAPRRGAFKGGQAQEKVLLFAAQPVPYQLFHERQNGEVGKGARVPKGAKLQVNGDNPALCVAQDRFRLRRCDGNAGQGVIAADVLCIQAQVGSRDMQKRAPGNGRVHIPAQGLRHNDNMQARAAVLEQRGQKSGRQDSAQELKIVDDQPGFALARYGAQGVAGFPNGEGVGKTGLQQAFSGMGVNGGHFAAEPLKTRARRFVHGGKPADVRVARGQGLEMLPHGRGFAVAGRRFDKGGGKSAELIQLTFEAVGKVPRLRCCGASARARRLALVGH